jgi:hypothetical protein
MESKSAYFRKLTTEHGMSENEAIACMAKQFERRTPEAIADLRREVLSAGVPGAPTGGVK